MIVLLSIFGVLAFLPTWRRLSSRHVIAGGVLLGAVILFYVLLFQSLKHVNDRLIPRFKLSPEWLQIRIMAEHYPQNLQGTLSLADTTLRAQFSSSSASAPVASHG